MYEIFTDEVKETLTKDLVGRPILNSAGNICARISDVKFAQGSIGFRIENLKAGDKEVTSCIEYYCHCPECLDECA